jgi:hypothetical protein
VIAAAQSVIIEDRGLGFPLAGARSGVLGRIERTSLRGPDPWGTGVATPLSSLARIP